MYIARCLYINCSIASIAVCNTNKNKICLVVICEMFNPLGAWYTWHYESCSWMQKYNSANGSNETNI